jgi:hypothetical protein
MPGNCGFDRGKITTKITFSCGRFCHPYQNLGLANSCWRNQRLPVPPVPQGVCKTQGYQWGSCLRLSPPHPSAQRFLKPSPAHSFGVGQGEWLRPQLEPTRSATSNKSLHLSGPHVWKKCYTATTLRGSNGQCIYGALAVCSTLHLLSNNPMGLPVFSIAPMYRKHCSERWSDLSTVTQLEVVLKG